jgi:hypothetical protein
LASHSFFFIFGRILLFVFFWIFFVVEDIIIN